MHFSQGLEAGFLLTSELLFHHQPDNPAHDFSSGIILVGNPETAARSLWNLLENMQLLTIFS